MEVAEAVVVVVVAAAEAEVEEVAVAEAEVEEGAVEEAAVVLAIQIQPAVERPEQGPRPTLPRGSFRPLCSDPLSARCLRLQQASPSPRSSIRSAPRSRTHD